MTKTIIPKDRTEQQDRNDIIVCANNYLQMVRCPGRRIIIKGYVCPHCDHDPSHGGCKGVTPKIPDIKSKRVEQRKNKKDRRKK